MDSISEIQNIQILFLLSPKLSQVHLRIEKSVVQLAGDLLTKKSRKIYEKCCENILWLVPNEQSKKIHSESTFFWCILPKCKQINTLIGIFSLKIELESTTIS